MESAPYKKQDARNKKQEKIALTQKFGIVW